jgi:hypothetical protein
MGIGDGDWGLGIGDWAQSPIPNPQSPIPNPHYIYSNFKLYFIKIKNYETYIYKKKLKNVNNK